jgi:urease subunit gamma/beta
LAQKRLARGVLLNYPESVALIASQLLEFVRDGDSFEQVQLKSKQILGRGHVQDGVDKMVKEVAIEATFFNGQKTVRLKKNSYSMPS